MKKPTLLLAAVLFAGVSLFVTDAEAYGQETSASLIRTTGPYSFGYSGTFPCPAYCFINFTRPCAAWEQP